MHGAQSWSFPLLAAQSAQLCGSARASHCRSAVAPGTLALSNLARREFDNSFRLRAIMPAILELDVATLHSSVRRIARREGEPFMDAFDLAPHRVGESRR